MGLNKGQQRLIDSYKDTSDKEIVKEIADIVNNFYDRDCGDGILCLNENLLNKADEISCVQRLLGVLLYRYSTSDNENKEDHVDGNIRKYKENIEIYEKRKEKLRELFK